MQNSSTLSRQLKEINRSTLHNIRFLLESYSNEVLEALDRQFSQQPKEETGNFDLIRREVSSVVHTLRGIETVINHHTHTDTRKNP